MTHWQLVSYITWALWALQTLLLAFRVLPRAAQFWQREGYRLRLREEQAGIPATVTVPLPGRKGERRGDDR